MKPQPITEQVPRQAAAQEKVELTQKAVASEQIAALTLGDYDNLHERYQHLLRFSEEVRAALGVDGADVLPRIHALLAHEAVEVGEQPPAQRYATLLRPGFDHLVDEQQAESSEKQLHVRRDEYATRAAMGLLGSGKSVDPTHVTAMRDAYTTAWRASRMDAVLSLRGPG